MKSILISIKPENALNILKGDKTLELRKSVPKGFVGWVFGYVTKGKPLLVNDYYRDKVNEVDWEVVNRFRLVNSTDYLPILNATIPFRFWFDEYEKLPFVKTTQGSYYECNFTHIEKSCMQDQLLENYGKGKDLYAWHIKKLEVFDKPMVLGDFNKIGHEAFTGYFVLTRPPQSWQYVWVKE
jgi:predicted transcriptional regulator